LGKKKITEVNALQIIQLIRFSTLISSSILLAKGGLGNTGIGQFEIFFLIAGVFSFIGVTTILNKLIDFSTDKDSDQQKIIVFNSFTVLFIFSVFAAIIFYLSSNKISEFLLNGSKVPLPLLLGQYIIFNSSSLMIEYIYIINKRFKTIFKFGIIMFVLQMLALGIPLFLGFGLNTILHGLLLVSLIKFGWVFVVLNQYSKIKFDFQILRKFLVIGSPLILSSLLSISSLYIDGFIITSKFSPDDFAIFQYGARELPLALLLSNSLSMAMLPRFAQKNIESPLAEFRSEVYRLHWFLFPIAILLLLTSHWFFPLVFNPQFEASAIIFNISLLLVISRVLFPQTLLIAKRMNKVLVWASVIEISFNVGFSLWLSSIVGIKGVAYGTLIAFICEKIFLMIACKKVLNISPVKYLPLKIYLVFTTLLILTFVVIEFIIF
jgi:O-antigen/teichoic acid export membrane protein